MNPSDRHPHLKKITRFKSSWVHGGFPHIDAIQLEAGPVEGWIFSATSEGYRINAGTCNRTLLYEGHYNPGLMHVGFIYSPEHTAVVHAHAYDSGTIALNHHAVSMHEIFPADMIWVDISASEQTILHEVSSSKNQRQISPRLLMKGSREELNPLIKITKKLIHSPNPTALCETLQPAIKEILSTRFAAKAHQQPFSTGDLFRAHLIEKIHHLAQANQNKPLSLNEICTAVDIKPRTVQKYFHELYGMGPTEYFRVRRLNGTRTDLLHGTNRISEVALRWGFTHLGRFSGRYKNHFGESPKTTRDRSTTAS